MFVCIMTAVSCQQIAGGCLVIRKEITLYCGRMLVSPAVADSSQKIAMDKKPTTDWNKQPIMPQTVHMKKPRKWDDMEHGRHPLIPAHDNEKTSLLSDRRRERSAARSLGMRHLQVLLMFLCLVFAYALRVNLSVGIVTMVNNTYNTDFEEYNWSQKEQGYILSSFFWGYVVTQVPAGQLAERFGPKFFLVGSMVVASLFTLLTPVAARFGDWWLVCITRVVQGLSQGFIFPSVHTLLAKWAPVEERGRLATYVYAGAQVGTILAMPVSGALAAGSGGWPSIFYVFGGAGLGWVALWFFLGADSPSTHKFISNTERNYIERSLGSKADSKKPKTPWKLLLKSLPMWSLVVVHCGHNWGFWTLLTKMPTYMANVLEYDIKDNSMLSALPYLAMWLMSFVFSWISDFITRRKLLTLSTSRKMFNTIGHWIPAAALIGLGYASADNPSMAVGLFTVAVGINASSYVGFQLNHIDISPNFAGTLMGITNCAANIMSIIAPLMVGEIVIHEKSQEEWRLVFIITAVFYFVGNLNFILLGKADIQPWNDPAPSRRPSIESQEGKTVPEIVISNADSPVTLKEKK